jgi:hypothetical protein
MEDAELAGRVEAELHAQGLTRAVSDPNALRQIARLLGAEDPRARERRLADLQRELADVELRFRLVNEEPS